jgi:threonylcarbamoyladenosine tRNA methylthiotransferase MtaB
MTMRVALLTLGCRVNQAESSVLEGTLKENGVTIVELKDNPDVCIVNTCTVTSKGDYNSRQLVRRAARAGAKVIVTGCYSQLRPSEVKAIPGVCEVVENGKKYDIVTMLTGRPADLVYNISSRSRPHLKVQDGCNFKCSYCSVPLARGNSRSITPEEAVERAQAMGSKGHKEIVLTGIHLGSYGRDLTVKSNLSILLKRLLAETDIARFRLSSLEIGELNAELVEIMQDKRICNHLHLPLQSGSDKMLGLMNRQYNARHYGNAVRFVADKVDNVFLGTDVIVGFPGEGADEFSDTWNLINDLPLSYLHIFPYSVRPGTRAASMSGTVSKHVVAERLESLRDLAILKKSRYMAEQVGRGLDVIIEDSRQGNFICATSANYQKILIPADGLLKGMLVSVRTTGFIDGMLRGIAIS